MTDAPNPLPAIMTKCDLRIVTDDHTFAALKPQWDELYQKSTDRHYTQSFDWCWCDWMEVGKATGGKLHCLIATEDDRLVLIWPLRIHRKYLWSIAHPLGFETTEYSNVLIEQGPESDVRMDLAWQALGQGSRYDVLRLPFVGDGSRLHRLIATRKVLCVTEQFATSIVDWMASPNWETYYRRLDNKQRCDIARRRRRLAEAGKVIFIAAVDVDQQSAVIDWIIEQKRQWLVRKARRNDLLGTEEYRRFLVAIAERTKREGGIVVSALKLNDTIIAASMKRVDGARSEVFLGAYDPSYKRFSPSHIEDEYSLKWCFERDSRWIWGSDPNATRTIGTRANPQQQATISPPRLGAPHSFCSRECDVVGAISSQISAASRIGRRDRRRESRARLVAARAI